MQCQTNTLTMERYSSENQISTFLYIPSIDTTDVSPYWTVYFNIQTTSRLWDSFAIIVTLQFEGPANLAYGYGTWRNEIACHRYCDILPLIHLQMRKTGIKGLGNSGSRKWSNSLKKRGHLSADRLDQICELIFQHYISHYENRKIKETILSGITNTRRLLLESYL